MLPSALAMSDAKINFAVDTVGVIIEMMSFGNESLTGLKPSLGPGNGKLIQSGDRPLIFAKTPSFLAESAR
jgi:hypothetical protein